MTEEQAWDIIENAGPELSHFNHPPYPGVFVYKDQHYQANATNHGLVALAEAIQQDTEEQQP